MTDTFLRLNGSSIETNPDAAYVHFMDLFGRGAFRFGELRAWLEEVVRTL